MYEGHEADTYTHRALLTGIFNRLGDGKGSPLTCDLPAWITRRKIASAREEVVLAREAFLQYVRGRA